jgi:hypothetical protein
MMVMTTWDGNVACRGMGGDGYPARRCEAAATMRRVELEH